MTLLRPKSIYRHAYSCIYNYETITSTSIYLTFVFFFSFFKDIDLTIFFPFILPTAVQSTKLSPFSGFSFPYFGDVSGFYSQGLLPFTLLQPSLSNPGNIHLGMFPQPQGTSEVVYELAAHVLFSVVDWARKLPTFHNLVESDRITLLKMAWSDLYLLESARSPIHMYIQQLYATSNTHSRQVSMETILKRMEYGRLFQDQVEKVRSLGMDLTEHFHIKCIVLFRTGEILFHSLCK